MQNGRGVASAVAHESEMLLNENKTTQLANWTGGLGLKFHVCVCVRVWHVGICFPLEYINDNRRGEYVILIMICRRRSLGTYS